MQQCELFAFSVTFDETNLMSIAPQCFTLAMFAVAVFSSPAVASAEEARQLRWKFAADKPLDYVIEQRVNTAFNVEGVEFTAKTRTTFDVTWTVASIGEGGVATIKQTIRRIQLELHAPRVGGAALGDLEYDSATGKEGEGRIWDAVKPVLLVLPGSEFTLTVSPLGELKEMELSDKLVEAIRKLPNTPLLAGGNLLTEEGLRQAMELAIQTLPEPPVAKDGSWQRKIERKVPNAGAIVINLTSTVAEDAQQSGRAAVRFALKSESTFAPAEAADAALKLEITEQSGQGSAFFDPAAGCTLASRFRQNMTLAGELRGNSFTQDIDTRLSVCLAGCELPEEEEQSEAKAE